MAQIIVRIDKVGNPTIEGVGFAGAGCKAATAGIEAQFAGAQQEVTEKPEMYMTISETDMHELN